MRKILLTTAVAFAMGFAQPAIPAAFINTNASSSIWICATPQETDLVRVDFEALTWVEIKGIGNHGQGGSSTNMLNYDVWGTGVIQKGKGLTDAGSPELELARLPTDAGQVILRAAALTNFNYAFKMIRNDPAETGLDPTIIYNRGLVAGPTRPFGRNEDFDLEVYILGFNQREVVVDPLTSGTIPVNSVIPAITGTATVGMTLTCSSGTWSGSPTYTRQWYAGGTAIAGATAGTFVLTAAQLGKIIQCRVVAANAAGVAQAFSNATAAVA